MSKARVIGLGSGILLIIAAFGIVLWQTVNMPATSTAFAQGAATATPNASSTTTPAQQQQAPIGDTFWTLLAGKLGVSADDLKTKAVEARKEMIDQAVKNGRLTQELGDAIKQRIDANNIIAPIPSGRGVPHSNNGNPPQGGNQQQPHRGPFGGFGNGNHPPGFGNHLPGGAFGHGGFGSNLQELEAIATAVKLEPKALIEQLSQGKTLADIATAQGVDQAVVKQAIIDFRKGQIDQQLALGVISEVQANQWKAQLTPENIDLSRGWRFQFRFPPTQKSSEAVPDFGLGEAFGIAPDADVFEWSDEFAMPFGEECGLPFGDVQTQ